MGKAIPLDAQKEQIIEKISPVINQMSPKWGEKITGILKGLDITKLLPLAEDTNELEKKVKEEEARLETEEQKKNQEERAKSANTDAGAANNGKNLIDLQ